MYHQSKSLVNARYAEEELIAMKYKRFSVVVVVLDFTMHLTSQVISIAFYSEREKSDKFCSEALIAA